MDNKVKKKKKCEKEYATQVVDEMKCLQEHEMYYDCVKDINGITTYKYKKTPQLFYWLRIFYS